MAVLLATVPAWAQSESTQPDAEDPPPPGRFTLRPPPEPQWYGATVLIVDGGSLLSLAVLPPVGAIGLGLGAPAVHVAHGRPAAALGSLALRAGAFLWAIALSMPTGECEETGKGCTSAYAPLPFLGAMAIDAAFIAWKTPDVPKSAAPALVPSVALTPGGGAVGLSGRF
jgi:hypothetical protein